MTAATASRTVGVVGLGRMGRPIARHIAQAGHAVVGFDRDPAATSTAQAEGITVAVDLGDLLRVSGMVLVAVDTEPAVRTIVDAVVEAWGGDPERADGVVVVLATITVTAMRELAEKGAAAGFELLDAPLCKGEQAADDGELLTLAGGGETTYERCRPVLESFSSDVYLLGGVGTGQAAKLVNNLVLWATISATSEGFWLAEELGADLRVMREALLRSSAKTWALETWDRPRTMPWAAKDMAMVLDEAGRAGLSLPMSGVVHEVIKTVRQRGLPGSASRAVRGEADG